MIDINLPSNIIKPSYTAQRCPVCNGWGTVSYKRITCHACSGRGYILIPTIQREKENETSK